ncbi:MAG: hypothetical protein ABI333_13270 [bacterium]
MNQHNFCVDAAATIRREPEAVARDWMAILRSDPTCRPAALLDELEPRTVSVLEALALGLEGGPLVLAADHFRAAVREFSFIGGWFASQGASPSLVSRYSTALGEALAQRLVEDPWHLRQWRTLELGFTAVMTETYCLSLRAQEREQLHEMLERCTPIVRLPGGVPALLVVGAPSRQVLSQLLGRLLLAVARFGADVLLVDFSNARELDDEVLGVIKELLEHRKLQARNVLVTALSKAQQRALRRRLGDGENVRFFDSWAEGLVVLECP